MASGPSSVLNTFRILPRPTTSLLKPPRRIFLSPTLVLSFLPAVFFVFSSAAFLPFLSFSTSWANLFAGLGDLFFPSFFFSELLASNRPWASHFSTSTIASFLRRFRGRVSLSLLRHEHIRLFFSTGGDSGERQKLDFAFLSFFFSCLLWLLAFKMLPKCF